MKMNQFLIDKVLDITNMTTLNIDPNSIDENEEIFITLAVQDGLIEISDSSIVLTQKGNVYLDFLQKFNQNSIRVGLK